MNGFELCQKLQNIDDKVNSFLLHKNDNRSFDDKEIGNRIVVIDYYDAVSVAYQNSTDLRGYLRCAIEDINKDLKILWKFIYRMLYLERRVKVVNKDANYLIVSCIIDK